MSNGIGQRAVTLLSLVLMCVHVCVAAELSVGDLSLFQGETATAVVFGSIAGDATFGVTIVLRIVPREGAVGTVSFTPSPPIDIVQTGDPWPDVGTFSPFDTALTGSPVLNGSVDDNGVFEAQTLTYEGPLTGFPVAAGDVAVGVWDVLLTSPLTASSWEGVTTTLIAGTITVAAPACNLDADCDNGNPCTSDTCDTGTGTCLRVANEGMACGDPTPASDCDQPDVCDSVGTCIANFKTLGAFCAPDADQCTRDFCDGEGTCIHPTATPGTACDDGLACTINEGCSATGTCSGGVPNPCDDSIDCTIDSCCEECDEACEHQTDDTLCGQNEICAAKLGCRPSCMPPGVEGAGSRYLAIRPQPIDSLLAVKLLVSSPEQPCLSKFVGFTACDGDGDPCRSDADCNACTVTLEPCLVNADCMTCSDQPNVPCQTNSDCNDGFGCVSIQTCQLSGNTCIAAPAPRPFDIDGDGVLDGTLATLVTDPADAFNLTPQEWVGSATGHCNMGLEPCTDDADCDVGRCQLPDGRLSNTLCSVQAQDCPAEFCVAVEICIKPAVYVTGRDIIPSEQNELEFLPTTYEARADCGAVTDPNAATMPVWADAQRNAVVNVTDISYILFVIAGRFDAARGITLVTTDLVSRVPCGTNGLVNAADLQFALKAFQQQSYQEAVVSTSSATGCAMPCP